MNLSTLLIMPLVMMADNYNVVITHTNGTKTEIPTEEVSSIEFQLDEEDPPVQETKLAAMNVQTTAQGENKFKFSWSPVANAAHYRWIIDGNTSYQPTTTGTQCTVGDLSVGEHTVSFTAVPATGSSYQESDPVEVKVTATLVININLLEDTSNSIKVTAVSNADGKVMVGLVPATVTGTADQIKYVKENSAAQCHEYTSSNGKAETVEFTSLTADTEFKVVAFVSDATDKAFVLSVSTKPNLNPGDKASVFPRGVSAQGGWVDVDKVGDLSGHGWTGRDNEMCWACAITGMIQWWLNDYKAKTGKDFETVYPIPTESECYSTPIMDLYLNYFPHAAGSMGGSYPAISPIKWFFAPVPFNNMIDGGKMLNESLPNWKGGFAGMTSEEAQALLIANATSSNGYNEPLYEFNQQFDTGGKTEAETIKIFSDRIIKTLRQGPVALYLVNNVGNVHGISCWGANYEVLSDGSFKVYELYVSENDPLEGNVKNGMNMLTVTYNGDIVNGEMPTTGGKRALNLFFGLRGYQGN